MELSPPLPRPLVNSIIPRETGRRPTLSKSSGRIRTDTSETSSRFYGRGCDEPSRGRHCTLGSVAPDLGSAPRAAACPLPIVIPPSRGGHAWSFDLLQGTNLLLVRVSVLAPDHISAGRMATPNFVEHPPSGLASPCALALALRTAACSGVSRTRSPGRCSVIAALRLHSSREVGLAAFALIRAQRPASSPH